MAKQIIIKSMEIIINNNTVIIDTEDYNRFILNKNIEYLVNNTRGVYTSNLIGYKEAHTTADTTAAAPTTDKNKNNKNKDTGFPIEPVRYRQMTLSRMIMNVKPGQFIQYNNGNMFDLRRQNLTVLNHHPLQSKNQSTP